MKMSKVIISDEEYAYFERLMRLRELNGDLLETLHEADPEWLSRVIVEAADVAEAADISGGEIASELNDYGAVGALHQAMYYLDGEGLTPENVDKGFEQLNQMRELIAKMPSLSPNFRRVLCKLSFEISQARSELKDIQKRLESQ